MSKNKETFFVALMHQYNHQNGLLWSRARMLAIIQAGVIAGAFAVPEGPDLMFLEWSKSTVFETVYKNHLHAEHALFERTDFKSVALSNLPALAGSGLVYYELLLWFGIIFSVLLIYVIFRDIQVRDGNLSIIHKIGTELYVKHSGSGGRPYEGFPIKPPGIRNSIKIPKSVKGDHIMFVAIILLIVADVILLFFLPVSKEMSTNGKDGIGITTAQIQEIADSAENRFFKRIDDIKRRIDELSNARISFEHSIAETEESIKDHIDEKLKPPPTPPPTPPPPIAEKVYIVQKGDALSSISARLGVSVIYLKQKNGITDINKIYIGDHLRW